MNLFHPFSSQLLFDMGFHTYNPKNLYYFHCWRTKLRWTYLPHRRSQGGPKGPCPPKFLENIVILWVERRFSKQNNAIRRKSNILPPQILGWLRHWFALMKYLYCDVYSCPRGVPGVKRNFWPGQGFRVKGQAKFLTFAKFMIYFCMSTVSPPRVRESTLAMMCLMSVAKIKF